MMEFSQNIQVYFRDRLLIRIQLKCTFFGMVPTGFGIEFKHNFLLTQQEHNQEF